MFLEGDIIKIMVILLKHAVSNGHSLAYYSMYIVVFKVITSKKASIYNFYFC